jgi:hypothetical protein
LDGEITKITKYFLICISYFKFLVVVVQVSVLHEQTERQSRRVQDLEKMLAAKKDMLRHTEQVKQKLKLIENKLNMI